MEVVTCSLQYSTTGDQSPFKLMGQISHRELVALSQIEIQARPKARTLVLSIAK
jgi:hypothetical protein